MERAEHLLTMSTAKGFKKPVIKEICRDWGFQPPDLPHIGGANRKKVKKNLVHGK